MNLQRIEAPDGDFAVTIMHEGCELVLDIVHDEVGPRATLTIRNSVTDGMNECTMRYPAMMR